MNKPKLVVFSTEDHDSYARIEKIPKGGEIYTDWDESLEEAKSKEPEQWSHDDVLKGMLKRGWEFSILDENDFELLRY